MPRVQARPWILASTDLIQRQEEDIDSLPEKRENSFLRHILSHHSVHRSLDRSLVITSDLIT